MFTNEIKNNKIYLRLTLLKRFFYIMGVKPIHIILPITLSFIAASFDGIGLGLLIPLAKGIVSDFGFISEVPILRNFLAIFPNLFPASFLSPNKLIFLSLIILTFTAVVFKNVILYINYIISTYWHVGFKYNVHKYIFDRFLSFGKLFFDRTNEGYLIAVLNYTDYMMQMLEIFERSIKNFFTLIVYFIIMSIISWRLTLMTILIFPILHYSLKIVIKKIQDIATLRNISWIELNRNVFNILSCIPLVKAYSKESQTKEVYSKIIEQIRKLDFRSKKTIKLIEPLQELIITLGLLLMVSIVALLLAKDKPAEISIFVVFFYAARRSLPMFNIFNEIKISFAQAKPPLKEIAKILDDKDKFFVIEGNKIFEGLKDRIDFVRLNFSYIPEVQVLKEISLSIEKGKVTAIVGPTGAGKTTLISLLMRFYDCPSSPIFIDGEDIKNFTLKSLRVHMALVSQDVLLFNDTLRNNLIFGLDRKIREEELIDVAKKARIYDFIICLPNGFDTEIGDRGIKLSGGERQRVAIARALLKGSEILILDEATSSLDTKTEALIQQAIDEAIKDRTAIVIAHRLSTIRNADKIVVIEDGRFVEEGTLQELLDKKGAFYSYWEAQKFY